MQHHRQQPGPIGTRLSGYVQNKEVTDMLDRPRQFGTSSFSGCGFWSAVCTLWVLRGRRKGCSENPAPAIRRGSHESCRGRRNRAGGPRCGPCCPGRGRGARNPRTASGTGRLVGRDTYWRINEPEGPAGAARQPLRPRVGTMRRSPASAKCRRGIVGHRSEDQPSTTSPLGRYRR